MKISLPVWRSSRANALRSMNVWKNTSAFGWVMEPWDNRIELWEPGLPFTKGSRPHVWLIRQRCHHLRQAKSNLKRATSDKGGYRLRAIDEVNKPIDETKKGIDAGE